MSAILTLNAGSSSLKIALYQPCGVRLIASGQADRIGDAGAHLRLRAADGATLVDTTEGLPDHHAALNTALAALRRGLHDLDIAGVGHRVVHGGPDHAAPCRIDTQVLADLEALRPFAPLHQPHNLAGIRAAIAAFPTAIQVACFDTAFHRTHPYLSDAFALPRRYYEAGVRRYGFHGLSYQHIAEAMAVHHPTLAAGRVVVAHLGNGASMCAIHAGRSIASSMGFSALDGLPMGTRCGQIDPGVLLYLMDKEGMGAAEISDLLYRHSGLLGVSGLSNDMRVLEASDAPEAAQAIGLFVDAIRRQTGALASAMGGIDALVFTAGIGEHSARIRAEVCAGLGWMGLMFDDAANQAGAPRISTPDSRIAALVIPTDEEGVIARATAHIMAQAAPG